jgi:hypothetical protein
MPRIGSSGRVYPMAAKLSDQATASRDLAKRARRLAGTLTTLDDAARLLRYADELEIQAADLDRRAKEDCQRRGGCGKPVASYSS